MDQPGLRSDEPQARNVALVIGTVAALLLITAMIFLLNSPVADVEAEPHRDNPATATLECGRPLLHDEDALRARSWSAEPAGRGTAAVTTEDVAACRDLVAEHRTRAWWTGGLGLVAALGAAAIALRPRLNRPA